MMRMNAGQSEHRPTTRFLAQRTQRRPPHSSRKQLMTGPSTRVLVAVLASVAMPLGPVASAHAEWSAPVPTDPNETFCPREYTKASATVEFQECIVVNPTQTGVWVQSIVAVRNYGPTSVTIEGGTETVRRPRGGSLQQLTYDYCAPTVIARNAIRWCMGSSARADALNNHGYHVQGWGGIWVAGLFYGQFSPTRAT